MGILNRIFKGKKKKDLPPIDLSIFSVDIHSHLVPGIDDGAKNMQDSISLIKRLKDLGYRKIITTPHIMIDHFKNDRNIIQKGLQELKEEMDKAGMDIDIEASAEYYLDEHFFTLLEKDELMKFGDNFILFELPFINETPLLADAVFEMQLNKIKPILAHVERYNYWNGDFDKLNQWKDKGVYYQLNINSLSGFYGPGPQKTAQYLIDNDMYDFIGSDCHHHKHIDMIESVLTDEYLHKLVDSGKVLNKNLL